MSHDHHDHHKHHEHHETRAQREASEKPWRVHPRWLIIIGFVLMALVLFTWVVIL